MRFGQPLDRLLLPLALNCAFGRAEIGSLLVGEVFLRCPHDKRHQELISHFASPDDSFNKWGRRIGKAFSEWLLSDK